MTKLKYDVSDIEAGEDREYSVYDGPVPKNGIYAAIIKKAEVKDRPNDQPGKMVEWILEIQDEPYEGCPLWLYTVVTGDEEKDWKFAEVVRALGMKDKGSFDDEAVTEKQPKVRVQTKKEKYGEGEEAEWRAKPRRIFPAKAKASKATSSDDSGDDSGDDEPPF